MKKILFVFSIFIFTSNSLASISDYCSILSDGSYELKQSCIEMEQEALSNINSRNVPDSIKNYCAQLSSDGENMSYALMESCIDMEQEAINEINTHPASQSKKAYCADIADGSYALQASCLDM